MGIEDQPEFKVCPNCKEMNAPQFSECAKCHYSFLASSIVARPNLEEVPNFDEELRLEQVDGLKQICKTPEIRKAHWSQTISMIVAFFALVVAITALYFNWAQYQYNILRAPKLIARFQNFAPIGNNISHAKLFIYNLGDKTAHGANLLYIMPNDVKFTCINGTRPTAIINYEKETEYQWILDAKILARDNVFIGDYEFSGCHNEDKWEVRSVIASEEMQTKEEKTLFKCEHTAEIPSTSQTLPVSSSGQSKP